jgi:soluble lytic murein transglycosylase-like protein
MVLALYGLSGSVPSPDVSSLPPVGAPPPSVVQGPEQRPAPADRETDPQVEAARRFLLARHTRLARFEIDRLAHTIVAAARENDFEPMLLLAVIAVESGGHAFAVSPVGALGLMQLLPRTGAEIAARLDIRWRGPQTLFDPYVNVRLGAAYLRELADRYDGELSTALVAYNWGPGRIDRRLRRGSPLPGRYSKLVLDAYDDERDARRSS